MGYCLLVKTQGIGFRIFLMGGFCQLFRLKIGRRRREHKAGQGRRCLLWAVGYSSLPLSGFFRDSYIEISMLHQNTHPHQCHWKPQWPLWPFLQFLASFAAHTCDEFQFAYRGLSCGFLGENLWRRLLCFSPLGRGWKGSVCLNLWYRQRLCPELLFYLLRALRVP